MCVQTIDLMILRGEKKMKKSLGISDKFPVTFFAVTSFLNISLETGLCTRLKFIMSHERSSGEDAISKS